jgi:hypothetical protein
MTTNTPKKPIAADIAANYAARLGEPIEQAAAINILLKDISWRVLKFDQTTLKTGRGKSVEYITKHLEHDPDSDPNSYIVRGAARFTDNSGELARVTIKSLDFKITVLD